MALLEEKNQIEIDDLREKANEYWDTDKSQYYKLLKDAWSLYPEPKNNWTEAYSLAQELFSAYLEEENFEEAKKWLNEMIENNNNLKHSYEDCLFNIGKYNFEIDNLDEAYNQWREVVRGSGGKNHFRYFEGEDKKYLEFYKSQTKLRESK